MGKKTRKPILLAPMQVGRFILLPLLALVQLIRALLLIENPIKQSIPPFIIAKKQ